ncbi:MAG: hypothetical protein WC966_04485 [Bradymonadales bacterium]|jgi:hypothetical protein
MRASAITLLLLVLVSTLFCSWLAVAAPILIVSKSQIQAQCHIAGKHSILRARLSDDLNMGIALATIDLRVIDLNSAKLVFSGSIQTNRFGQCELALDYPEGQYHVHMQYAGAEGIYETESVISCHIAMLDSELDWNLGELEILEWGQNLRLHFSASPTTHDYSPELHLSFPPLAPKSYELNSEFLKKQQTLQSQKLDAGRYTLSASIAENPVFAKKSLQSTILILDKLDFNLKALEQSSSKFKIAGNLRSNAIEQLPPLPLKIQFITKFGQILYEEEFMSQNDGFFVFSTSIYSLPSANYEVKISLKSNYSPKFFDSIRITHQAPRIPHWFWFSLLSIFALASFLLLARFAKARYKSRITMINPKQTGYIAKKRIPKDYENINNTQFLLYCCDKNSAIAATVQLRKTGDVATETLSLQCDPQGYAKLPLLEENTTYRLKIEHPAYLSAELDFPPKNIRPPYCFSVELQSARDYAIRSFSQIAEYYYPFQSIWGLKTARELCAALKERVLKKDKKTKNLSLDAIDKLEASIDELTFDKVDDANKKAEELYELILRHFN